MDDNYQHFEKIFSSFLCNFMTQFVGCARFAFNSPKINYIKTTKDNKHLNKRSEVIPTMCVCGPFLRNPNSFARFHHLNDFRL